MEVDAEQAGEVEIVVLDLVVGLVETAVGCLDGRHGMLSHRVWGVGRYAQHGDAVLSSGFLIDIVEAGAAQEDQADAAVMQLLDDIARSLVVDEDADRIVAIGEMCSLRGQTAAEVLDIDIIGALALVFGELAEVKTVIILRAEESYLQNRNLLVLRTHGIENFLDFFDSGIFIRSIYSDGQFRALRRMESQDFQHVVALSGLISRLQGDRRFQIRAGLSDKRSRASMDSERAFYFYLNLFHFA